MLLKQSSAVLQSVSLWGPISITYLTACESKKNQIVEAAANPEFVVEEIITYLNVTITLKALLVTF